MASGRWGRKIAAAAATLFVLWFCFGSITYNVTVPCEISANDVRFFSAPFQGTIREAHVEVGDDVRAGQLLYKMDTTELELQRSRLESEAAVARIEVSQALAAEEVEQAALANATLRVIHARLAVVRHQIEQAQVRAPTAGRIMEGELPKRVGEMVPLGESLLRFAPNQDWSIELFVPEKEVLHLREGFQGRFATLARPDDTVECHLARIEPASVTKDGNNIYIARADVAGNPEWMRVGMEGVATIDGGKKRVCWVALHRVWNFVRLHFWL